MQGIMSGLEPKNLKAGGFPDLSGDGKITQKDILMGRGVIPKKKDPKFNGKTDNRNNRIINVQEDDKEKA